MRRTLISKVLTAASAASIIVGLASAHEQLDKWLSTIPAPFALISSGIIGTIAGVGVRLAASKSPSKPRTISLWWVLAGLVCTIVAAYACTAWLLSIAGSDPSRRLDAIKTGLTVGAGIGGGAALLLSIRRQWLQEQTHLFERHDADERRITDLYHKAADQLGHEKAVVRLSALYSLERLANNHNNHRQTIVNVICAYLQMPHPFIERAEGEAMANQEEYQVRMTAVRIIVRHVRQAADGDPLDTFWPGISINVAGASLPTINLDQCRLRSANFEGVTFLGQVSFRDAQIKRGRFQGAHFKDRAYFNGALFTGGASFSSAQFQRLVSFHRVTFVRSCSFTNATFCRFADFGRTRFLQGEAAFNQVKFERPAIFNGAKFEVTANFERTQFKDVAVFGGTQFLNKSSFEQVNFTKKAHLGSAVFQDDVSLEKANVGEVTLAHTWPKGWGVEPSPRGGGRLVRTATNGSLLEGPPR